MGLEGENAFSSEEGTPLQEIMSEIGDNQVITFINVKNGQEVDPAMSDLEIAPGYYRANDQYPVIVIPEKVSTPIAVVMPMMNAGIKKYVANHLYDDDHANILLSMVEETEAMRGAIDLLDSLELFDWVTFISDSDLEDEGFVASVQLMIFIGPSAYWSEEMKINFKNYIAAGGNALIISDTFQDNFCQILWQEGKIDLDQEESQTTLISSWKKDRLFADLFSYGYGGKPDQMLVVRNKELSISKSFPDTLRLETSAEMGLNHDYLQKLNESGIAISGWFIYSREAVYQDRINTSGIFQIQFDGAGKIIVMSSEQLLAPYNITHNPELIQVFKGIIELLL